MTPFVSRFARLRARVSFRVAMTVVSASLMAVFVASPLLAAIHIGLASSMPAKGAHLMTAPTEIRLTFTGPIDVKKAGIELVGPDSVLVPMASLQPVADSVRVAVAKITGKLTSGTYAVKWKAVAADGAAGSGSFTFMYMASDGVSEGKVHRKP